MSMAEKIRAAKDHIHAAEKYMSTTFLRWKPDFEMAAEEFKLAAACYRAARCLDQAKECHQRSADMFRKCNNLFHAAKQTESAMMVNKETTPPDEIFKLATDSANYYSQHGSGNSAAMVLGKAARMLERSDRELAIRLYTGAADSSSAESCISQAAEYLGRATRLLVEAERYEEAITHMRTEIDYLLKTSNRGAAGRLCVVMVLLQLQKTDYVEANKVFQEFGMNCEASEGQLLINLLNAFDEQDHEAAKQGLNSAFIRGMDPIYTKMTHKIPLPPAPEKASRARPRTVVAPERRSRSSSAQGERDVATVLDETNLLDEAAGGAAGAGQSPNAAGVLETNFPLAGDAPSDDEEQLC